MLYSQQTQKQVFISFDKVVTPEEERPLKDAQILHLSCGGNELFGRSWNRKAKKQEGSRLKQCS